ncbi:MAG: DUF4145 domain-containing protein [Clostridiaceae bacterium]
MSSYIKDSVHTCYNCGNKGVLKLIGETRHDNEDVELDSLGNIIFCSLIEHTEWYMFECPVCHHPVIIKNYTFDVAESLSEVTIEFPKEPMQDEGIPKDIVNAFCSAVRTKGIDLSICLFSLRRVLEMICNDKNASGHTLEEKIMFLVNSKILPNMFDDACLIIRKLGNAAAHAEGKSVSEYDVNQVIDFLAVIIDYLYALPVKISQMKQRITSK